MSPHRAYVGIGTNLGDRERNVEGALEALRDLGNDRRSFNALSHCAVG